MRTGNEIIDTWFELRDEMLRTGPEAASALRPPSLRDACYAWTLAHLTQINTDPATIESFVNGLELGALGALREAWNARRFAEEPR
jgi:hypothetical protein